MGVGIRRIRFSRRFLGFFLIAFYAASTLLLAAPSAFAAPTSTPGPAPGPAPAPTSERHIAVAQSDAAVTVTSDSEAVLQAELRVLRDSAALFNEDELYQTLSTLGERIAKLDAPALQQEFDRSFCRVAHVVSMENALDVANKGVIAARERRDPVAESEFMICQGQHLAIAGEVNAAETAFNAAYEQAQRLQQVRLQADALNARGDFYSYTGNLGKALADLLQAQRLYEGLQLEQLATGNLASLAHVYRRMGDLVTARAYYQTVAGRARQWGRLNLEADALIHIGWAYIEEGLYELARNSFAESRAIHARLPAAEYITIVDALHLGIVDTLQGRHAEALHSFANIAHLVESSKYVLIRGLLLYFRGHAEAGLAQFRQALQTLHDAEALLNKLGNQRYVAKVFRLRSDVHAGLGQFSRSREDLLAFLAEQQQLEQRLRADESARLRIEFDTERTLTENKRLQAEQTLQQERVQALEETRRWQLAFMLLGGSVVGVLLVRQLRKAHRLAILAMTDELTRLPNRRAIQMFAAEAWRNCARQHVPLAVIVFDIDHFKRINDSWGHEQGDVVLRQVAHCARSALRDRDRIGRVGGEEFWVVLPGATAEQAAQAAERIRQAVQGTRFPISDAQALSATISLGVSCQREEDHSFDVLIARADAALYRAKGNGRNQVVTDIAPTREANASI